MHSCSFVEGATLGMLLELLLSSSLSLEQDFTPSSGAAPWIFRTAGEQRGVCSDDTMGPGF